MSQDETVSRKEKKAQRDADRRKKGKKRKHEEVDDDGQVAEQNELNKDFVPLDSGAIETKATGSKSKSKAPKEAKRKHRSEQIDTDTGAKPQHEGTEPTTHKPKKQKKTHGDSSKNTIDSNEVTASDKAHRFILFVGNLPYSATDISIRAHFKKLEPFTVRHRTDPAMKKSKGFAFLEFENYDRMKTCLKLYHHSMFDPDKTEADTSEVANAEEGDEGPKKVKHGKAGKGVRRINVELTAGGGGKAEGRKEKIRVKNERLGQQRQRRAEAEMKEREKKAKEEGDEIASKPAKKKREKPEAEAGVGTMMDVHPSRLARIAA